MKKKILSAACIVIGIAIICTLGIVAYNSQWFGLGKQQSDVTKHVIATVEDESGNSKYIYRETLDNMYAAYKSSDTPKEKEEILNMLIEQKTVMLEAEKRGFKASDDEAQKILENILNMSNDTSNINTKIEINELIKDLGMTEEEYTAFDTTSESLSYAVCKIWLAPRLISEYQEKTNTQLPTTGTEEYKQLLNTLVKDLKKDYKITYSE